MKYLTNIILGVVSAITAFCLTGIYGNGVMGFVVLMVFVFMGILVVLGENNGGL